MGFEISAVRLKDFFGRIEAFCSFWMVAHVGLSVTAGVLLIFATLFALQWRSHRGKRFLFFDPQDFARVNGRSLTPRVLPQSAEITTFEPMLKHYVGVVQLLVTVAAASIAFGNNNGTPVTHNAVPIQIGIAKLLLAYSIFYGVLFCALLLWRYDEYTQNMESYTPLWYSVISALGFACLICFFLGYVIWGFGLLS